MFLLRVRRDVARGRWLPGMLALALVAAQGAWLAHFALVKHAYCPEHGELVHLDAAPHTAVGAHPAKTRGLYAPEEAEQGRHEHCALLGLRREVALPASSSAFLPAYDPPTNVVPGVAWAPSSDTRFRLAPKQSPPA
jgi:hypothetical protein